jgi:hypothetical protein
VPHFWPMLPRKQSYTFHYSGMPETGTFARRKTSSVTAATTSRVRFIRPHNSRAMFARGGKVTADYSPNRRHSRFHQLSCSHFVNRRCHSCGIGSSSRCYKHSH